MNASDSTTPNDTPAASSDGQPSSAESDTQHTPEDAASTAATKESAMNDTHASDSPDTRPVEPIAPAAEPAPEARPDTYAPPAAQREVPAYAPAPVQPSLKSHSHAGILAVAIVASLLFGVLGGATGGYLAARNLTKVGGGTQRVQVVGDKTEEVVSVAAAVAVPSVVNIAITGGGTTSSEDLPQDHPDVPVQGEGSGVAYKKAADGGTYIITNNHVVEGADTITVTDSAGETYDATLVGADAESDIAVILVKAEIPVIQLGDSDKLLVGQLVIAIGSPFGLQQSVTSGVISALHRPLTDFGGNNGEYPYVDAIQTDAAINPGNSGGALVDRAGRLVGIPAAIYTDTGVSDGVGLAIPMSKAKKAAEQLIANGRVETPFLGVLGQTVTPALADEQKLPVKEGAYVVEVTAGTEAEKAGVKPGDVIVAVDKDKIRSMDQLILSVRQRSVGDKVTLSLWRDGKETTLEMTIGVKPPATE